uniref:Globin domain-containing protein n=1 Tax=Hucho hucho TaxID=62062 RepID=A0A4W5MBV4_9TELE
MASGQVPKLRFSELLDQRMRDRAGGKEQYKAIQKVWEGVRVRWVQAGYLSGGPPSKEQLQIMERELDEGVREARENESERNKMHLFKKDGTRHREKAEAELKIGTWAIEEARRLHPYKKLVMMGVVTGATDMTEGPTKANKDNPDFPKHTLYPDLSREMTLHPPPYSTDLPPTAPSHNPFTDQNNQTNPFLRTSAIQAPVLALQGGQLRGTVSLGITGSRIMCEEATTPLVDQRRESYQEVSGGAMGPAPLSATKEGGPHASTPVCGPDPNYFHKRQTPNLSTAPAHSANPDVLAVSESWLRKTTNNAEISIPNYIFRQDRTAKGGGVAIYCRDSLQSSVLLSRLLIVSPWTQRHFGTFGNLSTPAAIMGNPAVAKHGKTVMHGLDRAVQNLDDIKNTYTALSVMHSEKLHVDPDNFRLLADCITVCVATKLGPAVFNADTQEAFQKFLAVVVSALGRQYH